MALGEPERVGVLWGKPECMGTLWGKPGKWTIVNQIVRYMQGGTVYTYSWCLHNKSGSNGLGEKIEILDSCCEKQQQRSRYLVRTCINEHSGQD